MNEIKCDMRSYLCVWWKQRWYEKCWCSM